MQCFENHYFIHIICFFNCFWGEGKSCPWDSMLAKSPLNQAGVLWMDIPASMFPHRIGWHISFNCLTVQMLTLPSPTSLIPLTCYPKGYPAPPSPINHLHTNLWVLESLSQRAKSMTVIQGQIAGPRSSSSRPLVLFIAPYQILSFQADKQFSNSSALFSIEEFVSL